MMGVMINIEEKIRLEARKEEVFSKLEDLIIEDLDAMFQLDDYCRNRIKNKLDERAKKVLMDRGIIAEDENIPDLVNEAMFEMRTGCKPFWL